jgi:hypothetical protein
MKTIQQYVDEPEGRHREADEEEDSKTARWLKKAYGVKIKMLLT